MVANEKTDTETVTQTRLEDIINIIRIFTLSKMTTKLVDPTKGNSVLTVI